MSGFGILMILFASALLLVGIYMYTGHKLGIMEYRAAFRNLTIKDWIKIGNYTMIVSIFVYIIGVLGIIFHFE